MGSASVRLDYSTNQCRINNYVYILDVFPVRKVRWLSVVFINCNIFTLLEWGIERESKISPGFLSSGSELSNDIHIYMKINNDNNNN